MPTRSDSIQGLLFHYLSYSVSSSSSLREQNNLRNWVWIFPRVQPWCLMIDRKK